MPSSYDPAAYVKLTPKEKAKRKADRKEVRRLQKTELRATISRATALGYKPAAIAQHLGISVATVAAHKRAALDNAIKLTPEGIPDMTVPPVGVITTASTPAVRDEALLKRKAYALRKRAIAYADIARFLKVDELQVRIWIRQELARLEDEDLQDVNLVRRQQIEQIEQMMSAIATPAFGIKSDGTRVEPQYEAIDRFIKLLELKAKLLGLNAPQTIDINHRLEVLAFEFGYDADQLKDIARDVLAQRLGTKAIRTGS